jgi:1-acyl-sn-glycerol-3-phosphate acyltransferase
MSQSALLRSRRFAPFFWTQFQGALNDNVFKNALVILFAFGATASVLSTDTLVNLAGGIFILPFFLFSATAGQLADKYEKSRLIRAVKLLEITIMCIAALGFARRSVSLLLLGLFLMGVHSTLFGPVKYSILPQHLREEELVGGNAMIEGATFVAILVGTILGGVLVSIPGWGPTLVSAVTILLAVTGWLTSRGVPLAPAQAPTLRIGWNPVAETLRTIRFTRENHTVFLSILGISWFWFYGALFLAQFPGFGHEVLGGDEHVVTLLLAVFSVGIGLGCLLCERLSNGKIELGLVPFGSIGLSLFAVDLFLATRGDAAAPGVTIGVGDFVRSLHCGRIALDLALLGVFGGFFIVPLLALVQHRSAPEHRSRIIAGNNIINAAFMVVAAILGIVLRMAGFTIPQLFLCTAVMNACVAVYIYTLIPEFLMRFLVFLLVHTIYRVRQRGGDNLPDEGAAVLVCNHVSYVDALVIAAACRRPIRFVMDHQIFRIPVLNFIFRTSHAIPIAAAKEDPTMKARAFDAVAHALEEGELVCIFPEGRLTADGELSPFRPGVEQIIQRTPVPVVPMALRGLWGSFFSRKDGPAMRRPFRRVWSHIELVCGAPLAATAATAASLQAAVLELRGEAR